MTVIRYGLRSNDRGIKLAKILVGIFMAPILLVIILGYYAEVADSANSGYVRHATQSSMPAVRNAYIEGVAAALAKVRELHERDSSLAVEELLANAGDELLATPDTEPAIYLAPAPLPNRPAKSKQLER